MRGFLVGVILLTALSASVLALRPGGFRRQLKLVARRFRIVIVLGGVYVFGSLVFRLLFTSGPVNEWGPVVLAVILAVVFVVAARDPAP
ncbi:MAG TPA: hypothetical protein VJS19_08995 [Candidatus Dormibacteraeota bacterium]|nr:hypothetical protein [Candidatus Dormibacteraeota bacterium]